MSVDGLVKTTCLFWAWIAVAKTRQYRAVGIVWETRLQCHEVLSTTTP